MLKNSLLKFIKKVKWLGYFEGCMYKQLSLKYFLVFAWNNNDDDPSLRCKIAEKVDDMTCDYDVDWDMPMINNEVFDTELTNCQYLDVNDIVNDVLFLLNEVKII